MAQRAFVPCYKLIRGTANFNEMIIVFDCSLLEETVDMAFTTELSIVTQWSDNTQAIKTKILTAIMELAAANNYSTLQSQNVILPQYSKG
jgi:hypothetical protein